YALFVAITRPTHINALVPYTTLFRSPFPEGTRHGHDRTQEHQQMVRQLPGAEELHDQRRKGRGRRRLRPFGLRQINADQVRQRRSEEHTSELQSRENLVCRLLLEKKK